MFSQPFTNRNAGRSKTALPNNARTVWPTLLTCHAGRFFAYRTAIFVKNVCPAEFSGMHLFHYSKLIQGECKV
jgi:hypothetical protein